MALHGDIPLVVERNTNRAAARVWVVHLSSFLTVAPTGHESFDYALSLPMTDFEDAMQVAAAHACGAERIVTRNQRDSPPIPAITPEQALRELF